jgi:hypothetical protein
MPVNDQSVRNSRNAQSEKSLEEQQSEQEKLRASILKLLGRM